MQSGSQATRGVADLVLLKDAFGSLPAAFLGGFPFQPRQTSILTFLTVGVPALALSYWARPGHRSQQDLIRSLARFVLPASLTFCLVAIGVYLAVLLPAVATLPEPANPYREGALPLAQTALTVFAVLCVLAVVIFVQPPSRPDQDGHGGNWSPTLLALGWVACQVCVLAVAPLRTFFNLQALDLLD